MGPDGELSACFTYSHSQRQSNLVLLAEVLFLAFTLGSLGRDFLIVLLESSKILTGLGELTLLHTLTDVPVDEGTLGVHEVELVVDAGEDLSDGRGIGDHAHGALDAGKVATGDNSGRLVVDAALEAGRAPINELDGALGLDGGHSSIDILGDDVATVHEAARHVLAMTRIALGHHGGGLKGGIGDLSHGELLVVGLLSRDDRSVGGKHKVDAGVGHEVGLELGHVNVQGAVEAKGGSERGNDLGDEAVEVRVGRALNVEGTTADVVDGLVVKHDGDVGVLEERVGRQDGVVWLNNSGGDLRRGVDGEAKLGLLAVIDGESLEKERSEAGSGSTANGVEDQETLETGTLVSKLSDSVEAEVDNFFTNGVVTTGEVVGSILLTGDELLGVEELSVGTGPDLIDDGGFKIEEDTSWDVFSSTSFGEEGVEGIITTTNGFVRWHLSIGLNAVLEAEQFPTGVTDLDTSLTDVN